MCQIKVGIVQVNTKSGRKMSDVQLLFHALYHAVLTPAKSAMLFLPVIWTRG